MSGDITERLAAEFAPEHDGQIVISTTVDADLLRDAKAEIERLRALADQLADAVQGLRQAAIIGIYRPSEELAAAHSALAAHAAAHAAARTNGSASATDVGGPT